MPAQVALRDSIDRLCAAPHHFLRRSAVDLDVHRPAAMTGLLLCSVLGALSGCADGHARRPAPTARASAKTGATTDALHLAQPALIYRNAYNSNPDDVAYYLLVRLGEQLHLRSDGNVSAYVELNGVPNNEAFSQIASVHRHCYVSQPQGVGHDAPYGSTVTFRIVERHGRRRTMTGTARVVGDRTPRSSIGCGGRKRP